MTSVGAFFGSEFNQNGDLAHLEVFSRATVGAPTPIQVFPNVSDRKALLSLDVLIVGDASRAHHRFRSQEFAWLPEVLSEREVAGRHSLVIGSSYEKLAASVFGIEPTNLNERVSSFGSTTINDDKYWGYLNTEVDIPRVSFSGRTIGTQYFGPFLARNPWLLRRILTELNLEFDVDFVDRLESLMLSSVNYAEALKVRFR